MNQRPFGRPEAAFYELVAAPAVRRIVGPILLDQLAAFDGPVLDVGCGGGAISRALRRTGRRVVGVDPSVAQMRRTVGGSDPVPGVAASATALPFAGGSFDAVVSSCAIKHWPSRDDGIAECVRLLRPGGRLVLVEIDGGQEGGDLRRFAAQTRIPPVLRGLYPQFARRTFVPVSPDPDDVVAECLGRRPATRSERTDPGPPVLRDHGRPPPRAALTPRTSRTSPRRRAAQVRTSCRTRMRSR